MDGLVIINKPKNLTSNDVVQKVKKIFHEKIGHTGTLDPMATGVLPLLIGKGTLMSKYLINHNKTYEVELQLGLTTDTLDVEGKIIQEQEVPEKILEKENIEKTLKTFLGKQEQIPPMYSAIKVKGKKLYEYARKGENVEIEPRKIEIYSINLIEIKKIEKQIKFEVYCSKGTYIRSLCNDIAKRLNTIGYMSNLNRTQVGDFSIKNSVTIEQLEKNKEENIISIEEIFKNKKSITLNNQKLKLFLNGVKLTQDLEQDVYRIYYNQKFIGTGIVKNNLLKRDIVLAL